MDSIRKVIKGIGLKGKAATSFENLVYLNQSTAIADKEFYFQRVKKAGNKSQFYQLHKDQFFFYEKWYYPVIREFVTSAGVPEFIKKKARRDVLLKGIETIDTIATQEKYAAYSTVTMSKALYEEVREILDETRQKILSLVAGDARADEICEVVFQVFPVSQMAGNDKARPGEDNHAL